MFTTTLRFLDPERCSLKTGCQRSKGLILSPGHPAAHLHIVLLLGILALPGCGSDEADQTPARTAGFIQNETERAEVLSIIANPDISGFQEAFRALPERSFVRYTRTEQFDENGFLLAYRERTLRHVGPPAAREFILLEADSSGTFDFGFFRHFVSATVEDEDPEDLTPYLFPEDPMYLSERNFDAYLYRFLPDTLMGETMAQVIEVRARPVEGDGKNIRRATYFLDRSTGRLIAFELNRIDLALFFREESTFYAHIQRHSGEWVPYNTRFEARIVMPFKPPQQFRTVAAYSEFD